VAKVAVKYHHLVGKHAPHPGTGLGNRARARAMSHATGSAQLIKAAIQDERVRLPYG
jgi:hypothetical protein